MADGDSLQIASPFSPVLEPIKDRLPEIFATKFLHSPAHGYDVVVEGRMDRIWRRRRWLWPLFWLLAKADMFFPETGEDIPTSLELTAFTDSQGRPSQSWRRTFRFPNGKVRHFNASTLFDERRGQAVESSGPAGIVKFPWAVEFPSTGKIEVRDATLRLQVWKWQVPAPAWLAGTVSLVEEASESGLSVEMTISHPLLGPIFGYSGQFTVVKRLKA